MSQDVTKASSRNSGSSRKAMTYVSLAANDLAPVYGDISSEANWICPPIAVVLWLLLLKYILGVIYPTTYLTKVFPDRIVISDTSSPEKTTVYRRTEVVRFYIQSSKWWHNSDGFYPVLGETVSGQTFEVSWNHVCDSTSDSFFAAIREMWGKEYVPDV